MKLGIAIIPTFLALGCCCHTCPVDTLPPTATTAPSTPVTVATTEGASAPCLPACANLAKLGCPEADAATCYTTCTRANAQPVGPSFDVSCIASAKDIAAVRTCNVRCLGK
jgi:hypothetical protein